MKAESTEEFRMNQNPGCNSLIKKEDYDIPAFGMDSIVDFFPLAEKPIA
jgi:hypothetical protein